MGNCTSKVSDAPKGDGVEAKRASATKEAAVIAAAEIPEETPPETPAVNNEVAAVVAPPALTAAPPLPARPVAAAAILEVAGESTTSTPPPALEPEKDTEAVGAAATSSPPHPEKVEETTASADPPAGAAATAAEGEAATSSPPHPEKAEETAVSPDPPVGVAATTGEGEAATSSPPVGAAATSALEASDEATTPSPPSALEPEKEDEAGGASPPAPVLEPEIDETAASPEPPPAGEEGEQQEEQGGQPEEQLKQLSFDEWLQDQCKSMKHIPRKGSDELTWDEVYPPQKDREKPVTQCCAWMSALSAHVLMAADLGGGTLFDWWDTYIGKGETETDLTGDELCERAVVGLKAAIFPGLLEALEAGADEAEKENQRLKALLKNCFDAPAPPEGTTGGEDGESYPEPHSWVVGGYMYGFGPSHFTACLVSKDRKYVVGDYCSRPELEKALGRSVEDSEVEQREQAEEER